jgi:hypothetical protein
VGSDCNFTLTSARRSESGASSALYAWSSSKALASGPSSEAPETAPFVEERQCPPALLLLVQLEALVSAIETLVPESTK